MRFAPVFAVVSGIAVGIMLPGCGGESFSAGDDDAGAGSAGDPTGGTGSGGSGTSGSATAGRAPGSGGASGRGGSGPGQAGTSSGATGGETAGTGASGGSGARPSTGGMGGSMAGAGSGGQPAGGAGGEPGDVCLLTPESGTCAAYFEHWSFNADRGVCEPFIYGGCGGNENHFETLEACHAACAGHGKVDPTACEYSTDCVLTAARCCGGSNPPDLTQLTSVNAGALSEFTAPCQLVDCASTIGPIPAHFGATCSAGHCLAFDLQATDLVTCSSADECTLRLGLSCCEGCGAGESTDFVALRKDADITGLVCAGGPVACDACAPVPDPAIFPDCIEGRCAVGALLGTD